MKGADGGPEGVTNGTDVTDRYELVAPPADATQFESTASEDQIHWVNYEAHPAYSNYIASATALERIRASIVFMKYFLIVLFKRFIGYELIPAHLRKARTIRGLGAVLMYCLKRSTRPGEFESAQLDNVFARRICTALEQQGICVVSVPPGEFSTVYELVTPEIERLRAARGKKRKLNREFIESRATVLRTEKPDLFAAVDVLFNESGVYEAVSAYTGRSVELVDVNPQLNDHSDDFWRHTFQDMDMRQNKTAYFHRDASGGDIKAIVYLSDVETENGPFSFVIGSHKGRPSGVADWIAETNDHSGFSSTEPRSRRSFAALPVKLRRKCAFGNDISDDSDIAWRFVAAEWKITATRGHMVIFDTKGIHRGGMVTSGERAVVTCILG